MVVEERLGERRDGRRQSFEKTEDLLAGGSGSGCAAAGCDYDCAVAGRILALQHELKFGKKILTLLRRSALLRRTRKAARIHEVLRVKRRRVAIWTGLMHEALVWHSVRVGRTGVWDKLLV